MHRCARLIAAASLLWAAGAACGQAESPPPASPTARTIPWRSATYSHIADDEPLPTLLREFASDQGVSIVVSEKVLGKVRGRFGPMPPQQYLETITRQNGLIWYYDGSAVFVYRGDELESEVFQLRRVQPDAVLGAMRDLEVPFDPTSFRIAKEAGLVHVVGAPRFVAIVRNIALRLEGSAVQRVATSLSVRVFPLRYAWADDRVIPFNEATVVIPGVASLLRNLVGITGKGPQGGTGVRKTTPMALPSLAGKGLASVGDNPKRAGLDPYLPAPPGSLASNLAGNAAAGAALGAAAGAAAQQQNAPSIALETEQGQVPSIQEEPRLNAVIIQDSPDRFPVYESLISALDVPVGLVEIEAMLIDVSSTKTFSLGLPWTVSTQDGANSIHLQINPTDQANLVFTLVSGGVQRLLLQLQALAANGHAKLVARPAVLTLDNIEAHLESTQTIYVRVPGTYSNDLFNIIVGTTLRVTPHIVDEGGQRKIKLQVRVEDGTPLPATVDQIPTVQRNSVTTQAVLAEDQSLFIGGLSREDKQLQERGIPWLKDLPRIGALFRTTVSTSEKIERYVLLTPRIVSLEPPAGINGGGSAPCPPNGMVDPHVAPTPIAPVPVAPMSTGLKPSKTMNTPLPKFDPEMLSSLTAPTEVETATAARPKTGSVRPIAPKLIRMEPTLPEPPPQALRPESSRVEALRSEVQRSTSARIPATSSTTMSFRAGVAPEPKPPEPKQKLLWSSTPASVAKPETGAIPRARAEGRESPNEGLDKTPADDHADDNGWMAPAEWARRSAVEPKYERR